MTILFWFWYLVLAQMSGEFHVELAKHLLVLESGFGQPFHKVHQDGAHGFKGRGDLILTFGGRLGYGFGVEGVHIILGRTIGGFGEIALDGLNTDLPPGHNVGQQVAKAGVSLRGQEGALRLGGHAAKLGDVFRPIPAEDVQNLLLNRVSHKNSLFRLIISPGFQESNIHLLF